MELETNTPVFSFDFLSEEDQHDTLEVTKKTFQTRPDLLETIIKDADLLLNLLPVYNKTLLDTLQGIDKIITSPTGAERIAALTEKFGTYAHPSHFKELAQSLNIPRFAHVLSAIMISSQHALVQAWKQANILKGLVHIQDDVDNNYSSQNDDDTSDEDSDDSLSFVLREIEKEEAENRPLKRLKKKTKSKTKKNNKTRASLCSSSGMESVEETQHFTQTNEHQSESSTSHANVSQNTPTLITHPSKQTTAENDQQPIPDATSTKSRALEKNKKRRARRNKNKLANNEIEKILTYHNVEKPENVREILIYDIPSSWTAEKILQELILWGKVISLSLKTQHKYHTVRIKIELSSFKLAEWSRFNPAVWHTALGGLPVRWFPTSWTLEERKARETFQASVELADEHTFESIWNGEKLHEFWQDYGIKSFKIIKLIDGKRKLLAYFETNEALRFAIETPGTFNGKNFSFIPHSTPKLGFKAKKFKKSNNPTNKNLKANSMQSKKTLVSGHNSHMKTPKEKTRSSQKKKDKDSKKTSGPNKDREKIIAKIAKLLGNLV